MTENVHESQEIELNKKDKMIVGEGEGEREKEKGGGGREVSVC